MKLYTFYTLNLTLEHYVSIIFYEYMFHSSFYI